MSVTNFKGGERLTCPQKFESLTCQHILDVYLIEAEFVSNQHTEGVC